ncbi:MAG: carboxypeptidase-like regulatory domain-containing protein, partial [Chitinophagaceae bacterium]
MGTMLLRNRIGVFKNSSESRNHPYSIPFSLIRPTIFSYKKPTMRKPFLFIFTLVIFANATLSQTILKGTIKDSVGSPLSGASVQVAGTNSFTLANDKGEFALALKSVPPFTLQVSSVGFRQQDIPIAGPIAE